MSRRVTFALGLLIGIVVGSLAVLIALIVTDEWDDRADYGRVG